MTYSGTLPLHPIYQSININVKDPETNEVLQPIYQRVDGSRSRIPVTPFSANIEKFRGQKISVTIDIHIEWSCMDIQFDNFRIE
ncbi:MAG: hypothetical protein ABJG47_05745 [Ekhidna sp.]